MPSQFAMNVVLYGEGNTNPETKYVHTKEHSHQIINTTTEKFLQLSFKRTQK